MLTCLCDAFYGEVGIATVRLLRHLGCEVEFPEQQTCCGQPPYNSGTWEEARKIARRTAELFSGEICVTPSTSCGAMVREGYPHLGIPSFEVYELGEFIVDKMGLSEWALPLREPMKAAFHRACHGRALHLTGQHERLLRSVQGLEIVEVPMPEQCCGFGGAFSIDHPTVSVGIGEDKLRNIIATSDRVVSSDMGCLMHLKGIAAKQQVPVNLLHFAELLALTLPNEVSR